LTHPHIPRIVNCLLKAGAWVSWVQKAIYRQQAETKKRGRLPDLSLSDACTGVIFFYGCIVSLCAFDFSQFDRLT
jgi:predicted CoA-binding protein